MNFITKYQNYVMVGVIIIAGFVGYTYFFTGEEEPVLKNEQVKTLKNPIDQELIALLLQLKGISLDETIFDDPVFLSLHDFGQALIPEPVGRVNPFEPYTVRKP